MITSFFLTIFLNFLIFVLGLLPTANLDASVTSTLTNFVNYVMQFNGYFPIDTALTLLEWTVGFWLLVFAFDFFKWITHLVRGN